MIRVGDMVRVKTTEELLVQPQSRLLDSGNILDTATNILFNTSSMSRFIGHKAIVVGSYHQDEYRLHFWDGSVPFTFTEMMLEKI